MLKTNTKPLLNQKSTLYGSQNAHSEHFNSPQHTYLGKEDTQGAVDGVIVDPLIHPAYHHSPYTLFSFAHGGACGLWLFHAPMCLIVPDTSRQGCLGLQEIRRMSFSLLRTKGYRGGDRHTVASFAPVSYPPSSSKISL